jgi:hypothetical protein
MKLFRVTMYVKDLQGNFKNTRDLINTIEDYKHLPFTDVTEVLENDVGKWHDDHELNYVDCDYAKYFPDAEYNPSPSLPLEEYRRVRSIMVESIAKLEEAVREIRNLREKLKKLEKVETFMNSMKEVLK